MKKYFFILSLLMSFNTFSQDWLSSFEDAKKQSAESGKEIILVFSGSDWCAPCIKLDREIWSTTEFKDFAKEHYILLKADFPRRKKNALDQKMQDHNNALAEAYNKNGFFPFVVVLNKDGKVLGETGYKKTTPSKFINLLESFK